MDAPGQIRVNLMITSLHAFVPAAGRGELQPDEIPLAVRNGLMQSALLLTDRRLIGWRGGGVATPLPLVAIEHLIVHADPGALHLEMVAVPRQAIHLPLMLVARAGDMADVIEFAELVAGTIYAPLTWERWGPFRRLTLGR
jgi:hypothetical protein